MAEHSTTLPERSDEQLVGTYADTSRTAAERETAFRELTQRYRRRIFAVCLRVLGSAQDAEDATQETFVKLARGAEGFRGEAKLSTWLYRVAHNVCTDRVRYEARRPATPIADMTTLGEQPVVEDSTEAHATAAAIGAALERLDERSRQLLLLVAVEQLSYAEVAEMVDLAVGTVKSRVSRARATLGELLSASSDDPSTPTPSSPAAGGAGREPTPGGGPRAPPSTTDPPGG